jgi:hypothetical protein
VGKKLKRTIQRIVKNTRDFTDKARLNSKIADERQKIEAWYIQIGKLFHETYGASDDSPAGRLCVSIEAAKERITDYEQEICRIKGLRKCRSCGVETGDSSAFCSGCGVRMEGYPEPPTVMEAEPEGKRCTGCGAELSEGLVYCTSCGQKVG